MNSLLSTCQYLQSLPPLPSEQAEGWVTLPEGEPWASQWKM